MPVQHLRPGPALHSCRAAPPREPQERSRRDPDAQVIPHMPDTSPPAACHRLCCTRPRTSEPPAWLSGVIVLLGLGALVVLTQPAAAQLTHLHGALASSAVIRQLAPAPAVRRRSAAGQKSPEPPAGWHLHAGADQHGAPPSRRDACLRRARPAATAWSRELTDIRRLALPRPACRRPSQ
jgi:hypothetical protein